MNHQGFESNRQSSPEPQNASRPLPFLSIQVGCLALVASLFALSVFTSIDRIDRGDEGIILRFGRFSKIVRSGLHLKAPLGIDRIFKVPVDSDLHEVFPTQKQSLDSGFTGKPHLKFIGADLGEVGISWSTAYQVVDPPDFLFKNRNVLDAFRSANITVMSSMIAALAVEEVSTVAASPGFHRRFVARLQFLCDQYETGIYVREISVNVVEPANGVQ